MASDGLAGSATAVSKKKRTVMDIPGEEGWPIIGKTLEALKQGNTMAFDMVEKYGPIHRTHLFGKRAIEMYGPEANEFVLLDKDRNFSSEQGWNHFLKRLFPRGLMLMDFDHHRAHRKILSAAFKTAPMKGYLERLNDAMPARIAAWGQQGHFKFYPAIKQLSLDMAADVFFGLRNHPEAKKINKALTDMVTASITFIRIPLPFTAMKRGVDGRKYMVRFLSQLVEERRGRTDMDDMFTHVCNATDDDGLSFSTEEIVDHMIFMWMAAHDTITSSVTTLVYELGRNRDWQAKVRNEITALGLNDNRLPYDKMSDLQLTEYCFKEALRMNPPVPGMPRKTVKDVEFQGHFIPKGTRVAISPVMTHRWEKVWKNPNTFDPLRFSPEGGVKEQHKYAWIPFGGGAHMCLGLHFAYMQSKVIMCHMLSDYDLVLPESYHTDFQVMPLMKPVDGLPVTLKALHGTSA